MDWANIKQWLRNAYEASFSVDNPQFLYWWLGLLGVLLVLFIIWRFRKARQNFRVFRDESGVAETTNSALRDLVRIACDGVETASRPKIQFKKSHGRINVRIRAKLYQGQRLSEVRDHMRRRVTKIFQDTHGILVGDVSFTATGFKRGKGDPITAEPEPMVVTEEPKKAEEKPTPEPEPEPAKKEEKKSFGWSEPKPPAEEKKESNFKTYSRVPKEEEKPAQAKPAGPKTEDPKEDEEPKKKGGLFGGFGGKKNEPELIEDKPKKDAGDPLEDDDFSNYLAAHDPEPEKKPEEKK